MSSPTSSPSAILCSRVEQLEGQQEVGEVIDGEGQLVAVLLSLAERHGKNPAKSSVARKLLIAAWHMLAREEPFKPSRPRGGDQTTAPASSSSFLAA